MTITLRLLRRLHPGQTVRNTRPMWTTTRNLTTWGTTPRVTQSCAWTKSTGDSTARRGVMMGPAGTLRQGRLLRQGRPLRQCLSYCGDIMILLQNPIFARNRNTTELPVLQLRTKGGVSPVLVGLRPGITENVMQPGSTGARESVALCMTLELEAKGHPSTIFQGGCRIRQSGGSRGTSGRTALSHSCSRYTQQSTRHTTIRRKRSLLSARIT